MVQISCVSGTVEGRLQSLQRMVESVRNSVGAIPYEIILVACECRPETLNWIRAQGDCKLIVHDKRRGAVEAFNAGFAAASGDYVVTLNDDIAVEKDTISRAYEFMLANPEVGQVAFAHKYQNRNGDRTVGRIQRMWGYAYAQCGMTRRWIGEAAKWWGDYGLVQYGGDNHLSAFCWNLGYRVEPVQGCSVIDWEIEDDTRQKFAHQMRAEGGGKHPDTALWSSHWNGRLPRPDKWIPAPSRRVIVKAAQGTLRTLRFKAMMGSGTQFKPRTALVDVFAKYGPSTQANQNWAVAKYGWSDSQDWYLRVAKEFQPDLIMLQAQRPNNITPETARKLVLAVPNALVFNWDADTHYPMLPFHAEIAKAVHLQLTISPDLFPWYMARGANNIGYWPIGVEREFINVNRQEWFSEDQSADVVFLGSLYGEDHFPEALTRRDAVITLYKAGDINFALHGLGWEKAGIKASKTLEDFEGNPRRYSQAKMALSVSQTSELWGYSSDRLYNITATGCPALVQRFKGMEEHGYVDGDSCIAWSDFREMMLKVRHYKEHPRQREDIGRRGREVLLARHTWDTRVETLFTMIAQLGE